ncbi:uncharacterized protein F4812DRAFT_346472 [Daldinia caldariorum]|uniref:uncharacterized protein n=1 Tax=Daldinia caldariorum TaxID=326644 RepID=UPI002008AEC5|nr:uncharacterized protein F4812DRAFT_346472 [Daldinia caldariorum]KAI1468773.1 hypothetical protein F4812DRAFT_346472 [Daldinia caldariorum]
MKSASCFPGKMGIFKPTTGLGRPKTAQPDQATIRGRISGPIPIDDEFPIRGTGSAVIHEGSPEQLEPHIEERPPSRPERTPPEVPRAEKPDSVTPSGPSQASNASTSPQQQRTIRSSTLRYSMVSDSGGAELDRLHRKKSTLKSTLGRLFKRKKKSTSEAFNPESFPGPAGFALHEDDQVASNMAPKEDESKRSVSLPVTDFDRALRSHSIGPDDMLAITSARSSMQIDPVSLRRRAASSNRILSGRIRDFDGELIGLSPRPASTHGRGEHATTEDDTDGIGRAITSDSLAHRRRSRSLSQLQDIAVGHLQVRKRSDEIRYWRESFNTAIRSPNASTINNEDAGAVGVEEETPVRSPEQQFSPPTPLQPFNFGPMTGMKITQAAGLEDRIATLEIRNQKLERLMSQLFQVVPGVSNYMPPTPDQPRPRGSIGASITYTPKRPMTMETSEYIISSGDVEESSRHTRSQHSNDSFGDGNTFIGSLPPSSAPPRRPRPTSNSTVRGATSLPTLLGENVGPFTADHYVTLKALLDTERDARQALEARVTQLSHRLNLIARTPNKLETGSTTYSTVSAFDHDDDDEPLTAGVDTESELYKTPNEEPAHNFGAFGEELREDEEDGSRKKAARTLSLSQLTLKRPIRPGQNASVDL